MTVPAEQLLISSVLRNGDLQTALKKGVNKKMFHIYPNEYSWIEDFYLSRSRTPEKAAFHVKFPKFVFKVVDDTEYYSDEVREEHKLQSIRVALNKAVDLWEQHDSDGALNLMHSQAMQISSELGLINDGDIFRDHEDILAELAARKERFETLGSSGVPTGFETFDERTGGLGPGEFHIVAANTGVGKSFTMQKQAVHAALTGYKVQYYALEQPRSNVTARIISLISLRLCGQLFNAQNLMRGKDYDAKEFYRFMNDLKNKVNGKLHVADVSSGKVTTASIAASIERNKPDIVFVDHITLMGARTNDWQGIGEVADELTFIANRYSIPVVAGAQLNRSGKQDGSGPESIGEAYKIAQDASGMTLIRPKTERVLFYDQVKYRNGSGSWGWWAKFDPDNGHFHEIPYDIAQELIAEDDQIARHGNN